MLLPARHRVLTKWPSSLLMIDINLLLALQILRGKWPAGQVLWQNSAEPFI